MHPAWPDRHLSADNRNRATAPGRQPRRCRSTPRESVGGGPRNQIPRTNPDSHEPSPEPLYKKHGTETPRMQGPYGKGLKFHS